MQRYKYIGITEFLVGETALGRLCDGVFMVQVDRLAHAWSHGWHETPQEG